MESENNLPLETEPAAGDADTETPAVPQPGPDWIERNFSRIKQSSLRGQLLAVILLKRRIGRLTIDANKTMLSDDQVQEYPMNARLKDIQDTENVHDLTIRHLQQRLFWAMIAVFLLIAIWLFFVHIGESKISIEANVSSVTFEVADNEGFDYFHPVLSNDSIPYAQDSAALHNGHDVLKYYGNQLLVLDTLRPFAPLELSALKLPVGATVTVDHTVDSSLMIKTERGTGTHADSVQTWKLGFKKRIAITDRADTIISKNTVTQGFRRVIDPTKPFVLTFDQEHSWKWPARLFIKSLSFKRSGPGDNYTMSSISEGKITLLETGDTLLLHERDKLQLEMVDSVELFLEGDGRQIRIRTEGNVRKLLCGPSILSDKENNRMPTIFQFLSKSTAYLWTVLAVIVPVLVSLFIRQRRSL